MTIYSLDVLLSQFGTSLFHVQFKLLLPDLHTDSSRGRPAGLVFPSPLEFSTVFGDPHSQKLCIVNNAVIDVFLELSCFFDDPTDVSNLISGTFAFLKSNLNIWKFSVHILMTPILSNMSIYSHPAYLNYMQSTSCEMLGWMKHKLESSLPGEISITSDMQMIPPYGRK